MIILGIDPGLKATGYGLIELADGRTTLLEAGTIDPNPKNTIQEKIDAIYQNLEELAREYRPDVLVLEKLYSHARHPATSITMGHARGVICLLSKRCGIDLNECSVKRIRKALTGNGNASKEQTRAVVAHILSIDQKKLTLDASDALALALGYVNMQRLAFSG
jgi:crossover junction endodeoxyribonuclease RuvC